MIRPLQVGPAPEHFARPAKPLILGLTILSVWLWHASTKGVALLPEMFWACNCASLAVAVGLLAGSRRLVEAGVLFHLSLGLPGYALDTFMSTSTSASSVLVHVLPLVCGIFFLRGGGYAGRVATATWFALICLVIGSHLLLPAALNVNLSHRAWPHLPRAVAHPWLYHMLNAALSFTFLHIGQWALRRLMPATSLPPA